MNATQTRPAAQPRPVISARNATTHGLFARDVVLPHLGEDPGAFDALLQRLAEQLPPRNLLDRHYLEQIAAASWRLRRLHRWQAQIYEDDTLTEDQRLDKLDRVLRHENTLARQIDRAVRMMGRDVAHLFGERAGQEALEAQDVTAAECAESADLAICVQRRVWQKLHAAPDTDLASDGLDNTHPAPDTGDTQICQNEPPPQSDHDELDCDVSAVHPDGRPVYLSVQAWENQSFMRALGNDKTADEHAEYFRDCFLTDQAQRRQALGIPLTAQERERLSGPEAQFPDEDDEDIDDNEICENETWQHPSLPNLPLRGDPAKQGREVSRTHFLPPCAIMPQAQTRPNIPARRKHSPCHD